MTRDGIKHLARLQDGPAEFRVAAQLSELLRASVPVGKPEPAGDRGVLIQRRVAAAVVDGEIVPVRITTKQYAGRTTLHHLETAERHSGISRRLSERRQADRIESGVPAQTVADLLPDVKSQPDGTYTARFAQAQAEEPAAARPAADRKKLDKLERRFRRMFPALFAAIDVRIDDVQRALRAEGENPPDRVQAAYLPRLHAEKDLIVIGLDTALRNDGKTGLARLLHESGHAYWRMLSPETRETLRTLYERDLREQWSPLWRDGELATEVSQNDILDGGDLGLEEWFSELMAAVNADWAERRGSGAVPGWVRDLATRLREILARVWHQVADFKGLQAEARSAFLVDDFRAFLTQGHSAQRTQAAGAAFARQKARFAQSQKIVAAKQVDATATGDDRTLANRWIGVMPAFQGGKYQMAEPAAAMIRQAMPETERAKITTITDYFGGGGWWGSYLALTHFPNVRRIVVNEFDALRAAKIRLLHEAPDKVAQFLDDATVRAALQQVREWCDADAKTSGSALAARLHILPSILRDFPHAAGLAGLLKDAAMSARGRAEDATGTKTAAASLDKLLKIALRDAKQAAEGAAELRRRGVSVEVVQGDAYARNPEAGDRALAVFDPPYYLTTGYDGGIVPLGIYEKTAAAVQDFAASGNAILYTDSGWWLDAPEKAEQTADIFSGQQADRAALSRIVDSLNAVGIVPVEGRHEIIGINRPGERHGLAGLHRQPERAQRAGNSGQTDGQLSERRGGSTAHDQAAVAVDAGAAKEARPVPADTRERFEQADRRVTELETQLAALAEGESQGGKRGHVLTEVDSERETAGTGWLVMDRTGKVNTGDGV